MTPYLVRPADHCATCGCLLVDSPGVTPRACPFAPHDEETT